MTLEELYKQKGEIITTLEISQAKLKAVNEQIVNLLNKEQNERNTDVAGD